MVCSTNGERLDHPGAHLVVLRLLLTESGHYILPINHNQKDLELTETEKLRIKNMMQGPQQPSRSATLEQSGMSGISGISELSASDNRHDIKHDENNLRPRDDQHAKHYDDQPPYGDDESLPKEKLQFAADSNMAHGLHEGQKIVAEDEPPIQGFWATTTTWSMTRRSTPMRATSFLDTFLTGS